jgi:undecaprenyl-diphosphatase
VYNLLIALLLGVVEGITEFIPVSSTGHMVLCQWWLGIDLDDPFWKLFTVFIQIGAILAVVVYFRDRLMNLLTGRTPHPSQAAALTPLELSLSASAAGSVPRADALGESPAPSLDETETAAVPAVPPTPAQRYWALWMIAVGTIPVLIAGYLTHKWVEKHLGSPLIVALALGLGGLVMILIELLPLPARTDRLEKITFGQALGIGIAQILAAIFPGTSRSFVTIMGGMLAGLTRQAATEFSFFLAIPAMFAACGYDLLKHRHDLHGENILLLLIGTLVAFLVAWIVIAAFMSYIRKHNFIPFGIWRIAVALLVFLAYLHARP